MGRFGTWNRLPLYVAAIHQALVLATAAWIANSGDGQAPLVWVCWAVADLPVSLLYYVPVPAAYTGFLETLATQHGMLALLLYPPCLIHAIAGTLWWCCLAAMCRRFWRRCRA